MRRDDEAMRAIDGFIEDYMVLDGWPTDEAKASRLADLIRQTYLNACVDVHSAKLVHAIVMRNEDRAPKPATIRRWMRELNQVELDADEEIGV